MPQFTATTQFSARLCTAACKNTTHAKTPHKIPPFSRTLHPPESRFSFCSSKLASFGVWRRKPEHCGVRIELEESIIANRGTLPIEASAQRLKTVPCAQVAHGVGSLSLSQLGLFVGMSQERNPSELNLANSVMFASSLLCLFPLTSANLLRHKFKRSTHSPVVDDAKETVPSWFILEL